MGTGERESSDSGHQPLRAGCPGRYRLHRIAEGWRCGQRRAANRRNRIDEDHLDALYTPERDHPEVVNSDPYGKGWMVVIELSNAGEVDKLMTAAQYDAFLANQKKG